MTRDVDEFLAVLDRWSDEIAKAATRADALAAMTPPSWALDTWRALSSPGGWARIEDPT